MSWQQQYLAYDEDSLATYANTGLVRRALKDIDARKVILQQEQADAVIIESDQQQVCLPATGLLHASCTCPATGACKHIVAAVLYFQHYQNETGIAQQEGTQETGGIPVQSAQEFTGNRIEPDEQKQIALNEVLALDLDQIAKKIGKAQREKAVKLAYVCQQELEVQLTAEPYRLKIRISGLNEEISYMAGAGFAGMLSDIEKDRDAWHLVALSEVHRLQGKTWSVFEQDIIQPEMELSLSEQQFILDLQDDLTQLLKQGLSHISELVARQLHLLNLSAKSEGLPVLAAMLRQLSGQVHRLVHRDEQASERDTLLSLARMSAYLYRLQHAQGENLQALRGKARKNYTNDPDITELKLVPLGARWWRTQGGARGLTLYFWQPESQEKLQVTLARAEGQDPGFDRYRAWARQSLWTMTPQGIMQQAIRLQYPRFSEEGNLAASGQSKAFPLGQSEDLQELLSTGFDDWQTLQLHWQAQLKNEQKPDDTVLLCIARYEPPRVDEIEQCLWWRVYDRHGHGLLLRLDWKNSELEKIRQLEQLCSQSQPIWSVFAYVMIDGDILRLSPVSVILEQGQKYQLFNFDFDQFKGQKKTLKESILGRIEQLLAKKKQQQQYRLSRTPNLVQKICEPVLSVLETLSCTGRMKFTPSQLAILKSQQQLAEEAGMNILAKALEATNEQQKMNARQVMTLVYICDAILRMQVYFPIEMQPDMH